jgi:hypothetical protein
MMVVIVTQMTTIIQNRTGNPPGKPDSIVAVLAR